ncbi:hypothetical protein HDU67_003917 [Dinochytrium kinnereticum]|nr:hypothetical protein HDU67_003917 [Dinochytrium kinnereticum]
MSSSSSSSSSSQKWGPSSSMYNRAPNPHTSWAPPYPGRRPSASAASSGISLPLFGDPTILSDAIEDSFPDDDDETSQRIGQQSNGAGSAGVVESARQGGLVVGAATLNQENEMYNAFMHNDVVDLNAGLLEAGLKRASGPLARPGKTGWESNGGNAVGKLASSPAGSLSAESFVAGNPASHATAVHSTPSSIPQKRAAENQITAQPPHPRLSLHPNHSAQPIPQRTLLETPQQPYAQPHINRGTPTAAASPTVSPPNGASPYPGNPPDLSNGTTPASRKDPPPPSSTRTNATGFAVPVAPTPSTSLSRLTSMPNQSGNPTLPATLNRTNFLPLYAAFLIEYHPTVYCHPPPSSTVGKREKMKDCRVQDHIGKFENPPTFHGKKINAFSLFAAVVELGGVSNIKAWSDIARRVGYDPKGSNIAARLKAWTEFNHINAFYDYLLGKHNTFYSDAPPRSRSDPAEPDEDSDQMILSLISGKVTAKETNKRKQKTDSARFTVASVEDSASKGRYGGSEKGTPAQQPHQQARTGIATASPKDGVFRKKVGPPPLESQGEDESDSSSSSNSDDDSDNSSSSSGSSSESEEEEEDEGVEQTQPSGGGGGVQQQPHQHPTRTPQAGSVRVVAPPVIPLVSFGAVSSGAVPPVIGSGLRPAPLLEDEAKVLKEVEAALKLPIPEIITRTPRARSNVMEVDDDASDPTTAVVLSTTSSHPSPPTTQAAAAVLAHSAATRITDLANGLERLRAMALGSSIVDGPMASHFASGQDPGAPDPLSVMRAARFPRAPEPAAIGAFCGGTGGEEFFERVVEQNRELRGRVEMLMGLLERQGELATTIRRHPPRFSSTATPITPAAPHRPADPATDASLPATRVRQPVCLVETELEERFVKGE